VIFLQITKIILERNGNLGIFVSDGLVYVGLKPYAIKGSPFRAFFDGSHTDLFSIGLTPYAGIVRPFRAFGFSEFPLTPLRLRSVTVLPHRGEGDMFFVEKPHRAFQHRAYTLCWDSTPFQGFKMVTTETPI